MQKVILSMALFVFLFFSSPSFSKVEFYGTGRQHVPNLSDLTKILGDSTTSASNEGKPKKISSTYEEAKENAFKNAKKYCGKDESFILGNNETLESARNKESRPYNQKLPCSLSDDGKNLECGWILMGSCKKKAGAERHSDATSGSEDHNPQALL